MSTLSMGDRPARILVLEDEPDLAGMVELVLRGAGARVDLAVDRRSALALLDSAARPYDALVLDVGLPDGSGLDVLARARSRWPAQKVILSTAWAAGSLPLASFPAPDAILCKPYHLQDLPRALGRLLRRGAPTASSTGSPPASRPPSGRPPGASPGSCPAG